jgi:hypothetical protein
MNTKGNEVQLSNNELDTGLRPDSGQARSTLVTRTGVIILPGGYSADEWASDRDDITHGSFT